MASKTAAKEARWIKEFGIAKERGICRDCHKYFGSHCGEWNREKKDDDSCSHFKKRNRGGNGRRRKDSGYQYLAVKNEIRKKKRDKI